VVNWSGQNRKRFSEASGNTKQKKGKTGICTQKHMLKLKKIFLLFLAKTKFMFELYPHKFPHLQQNIFFL